MRDAYKQEFTIKNETLQINDVSGLTLLKNTSKRALGNSKISHLVKESRQHEATESRR